MNRLSLSVPAALALALSTLASPARAGAVYDFVVTADDLGGWTGAYSPGSLNFVISGAFEMPDSPGYGAATLTSATDFIIGGTTFGLDDLYVTGVAAGSGDSTYTQLNLSTVENAGDPTSETDGFKIVFSFSGPGGLGASPSEFTMQPSSVKISNAGVAGMQSLNDDLLTGSASVTYTQATLSDAPLPAAATLLAAAIGGLGVLGARRRRAA